MKKNKALKKISLKSSKHIQIKDDKQYINYDLNSPIFSFYHMIYGSSHCLSQSEKSIKTSVVDTLLKLSQKTWQDLKSEPKEGLGFEKIPQNQLKFPLPEIVTKEVPITVFRYSSSGRIAGFRTSDIYHILAIGPKLYPH